MAAPAPERVASALRTLIRAQREVFVGDRRARIAARALNRRILTETPAKRGAAPDLATGVEAALQAAEYFRRNVVQAVRDGPEGRFRLNIRETTERGDNDTIRQGRPEGAPPTAGY